MQNNVTDLSQKLQRSLDNNYNVVDMPAVIEVITALEKTSVTKELLETTRLGKYINELRRRTTNDSLAKRAKELLKKWRDLILPDANGQIKRSESPSSQRASKKRTARTPDSKVTKKIALNGSRELEFSDNSNCSIKDLKKTDVIFINSDSNSSIPDQSNDATSEDAIPKKRGRKKGSKNHKNLVIAAEESFSNKMAVSRNSKVKTTQELLADLQNRATTPKNSTAQDIELRAAQLTESLSRIDQKLNPQKQINKNVTPIKNSVKPAPHRTINEVQSWSRTSTPEIVTIQSDDEILDVVGDSDQKPIKPSSPLTIESLLAKLPPIDPSCLDDSDSCPPCLCPVPEPQNPLESPKSDSSEVAQSVSDRTNECSARAYLQEKYGGHIDPIALRDKKLPNLNGNFGVPCENYQKYSISDNLNSAESETSVSDCDKSVFREWHETLDVVSYDSELLRILPYVVID